MRIIDSLANFGIKISFLLLHVFSSMDADIEFPGKCVLTLCGGLGQMCRTPLSHYLWPEWLSNLIKMGNYSDFGLSRGTSNSGFWILM